MRHSFFCLATILSLSSSAFCAEASAPVTPAAAPAQAAVTAPFKSFTGRVIGQKVRLRTGCEGDSAVVKEVNRGEMLIVEGEKQDFYTVHPPKGTKGYVFRSFVIDNVVEGSRVNVRLAPDLDAPIIGQLQAGTHLDAQVCATNNKWLEITPSEGVHFYIAKKYVEYAGDANFMALAEQRRQEVNNLLNSAYLVGQAELRKPFPDINLSKVHEGFDRVIVDYKDFSEQAARAQDAKKLVQETYLQKQIAYLEVQARQSSDQLAARNAALTAELANYQDRLQELEISLNEQRVQAEQAMAQDDTSTSAPTEPTDASAPVGTPSNNAPTTPKVRPAVTAKPTPMTDQMRQWEPVEQPLFREWQQDNDGHGDEAAFYADQRLNGEILHGIILHFDRPVKNPPGDYVLVQNNKTVAYLYSTQVNLDSYVGREVTLLGSPRDNHHFAFPAYFVLKAE